jgi:hypothetical protein
MSSDGETQQQGGTGKSGVPGTEATVLHVDGVYYFPCPHCGTMIGVDQINCTIFRCGTLANGQQIPPHAPKAVCDKLRDSGKIRGCAMPFKFDGKAVQKCGYL